MLLLFMVIDYVSCKDKMKPSLRFIKNDDKKLIIFPPSCVNMFATLQSSIDWRPGVHSELHYNQSNKQHSKRRQQVINEDFSLKMRKIHSFSFLRSFLFRYTNEDLKMFLLAIVRTFNRVINHFEGGLLSICNKNIKIWKWNELI